MKMTTYFWINANVYETLKDDYNDKYEYILPNITFDKNLFSEGSLGIRFELKFLGT